MGLLRFLHLIKWFTKAKVKIHQEYKRFVPTRWRSAARWVWGIALVSGVLWWQAAAPAPPLVVYFYDVGQGDAIHIRTAAGFDVLIDGGPTGRVVEKLGRTLPFWDDTIELMILTHPHADHVTGQIEVLKRFNVEKVLATGVLHTTDEYLAWLKEIKEQGIPLEIARAGMRVGLGRSRGQSGSTDVEGMAVSGDDLLLWNSPDPAGHRARRPLPQATPAPRPGSDSPRAQIAPDTAIPIHIHGIPTLTVLWPQESFEGKRVREGKIGEGGGLNDTSVVAKLTFGKVSFLLMGDATSAVEKKLVASGYGLVANVLKVGHHGSKYSTSREFLKAVQPKYAVIQVGENRYGHPAFATLHRLNQAGVTVLRNDQDGDVVFETDGLDIKRRP